MTNFETSTMNCTVTEYFEQIALSCSTNIAIQSDDLCWSYNELNQHANQITHQLLQKDRQAGGQVIIFCDELAWQIAALLAVIKAGKTVVIADSSLPEWKHG